MDPTRWELDLTKSQRRRFPRFKLDTAIRVTEVHSGLSQTVKGRSREISEGGMGGILAGELSAGKTVLVEFPLPTSRQELTLRALVHRHSMSHYGFEFLQTSSVVLQDIRRACEKLPTHT
ncbi:MAG TPA: PilZ domain-containing protein [Terriglobales bacterium]|nr:PilZ domain-containing protein [Terriglobales bacterium]